MIALNNIFRYYQSGISKNYVLQDVTLEIDEGEFVTIMGPSGAGKSTLLHIMGMLDAPSGGSYNFLGEPVHEMSEKRRSEFQREFIGFVFQSYHLIDELTVAENLETPLLYKKIKKSQRQGMVAEMLDRFQMVGKKDLFPNQLSGGQQQLVGVARALIISPRLILADEPTGNLNSKQSEEIMELLTALNGEGVTIVQVTHSERNAEYSDRIIHLLDGRVVDS